MRKLFILITISIFSVSYANATKGISIDNKTIEVHQRAIKDNTWVNCVAIKELHITFPIILGDSGLVLIFDLYFDYTYSSNSGLTLTCHGTWGLSLGGILIFASGDIKIKCTTTLTLGNRVDQLVFDEISTGNELLDDNLIHNSDFYYGIVNGINNNL